VNFLGARSVAALRVPARKMVAVVMKQEERCQVVVCRHGQDPSSGAKFILKPGESIRLGRGRGSEAGSIPKKWGFQPGGFPCSPRGVGWDDFVVHWFWDVLGKGPPERQRVQFCCTHRPGVAGL